MANGEPEKKYFDVARPAGKRASFLGEELAGKKMIPLLEDVTDDTSPADVVPASGAPFKPDGLLEPEPAEPAEAEPAEVSHAGFTITPLPLKDKEPTVAEESSASPTPSEPGAGESVETEPDEPQKLIATTAEPSADTGPEVSVTGSGGQDAPEPANKDVPIPGEQFASANITEDPGKKTAETAQAEMQEPKIYDTKEYYVPIGKMHHKHGGMKGAFIFGIICAIVVVTTTVYVMYKLSF
jgi:hypothetical protein